MARINKDILEMFEKLKDYIGIYVRCKYWLNEKLIESIIKFDRVDEYDSIFDVDTYTWIYFLSHNQCIILIETLEGHTLYENKIFEKEYKKITNEDELYRREKLVYGEDYISEDEKNSKTYLTKKGLEQINENLKDEWIEFVELNIPWNLRVVKATISMLEKINQGISFYNAEIMVYSDEFSLYGTETNFVDEAVKRFCKKRKEYREYLNNEVYSHYYQQSKPKKISKKIVKRYK